MSIQLMVVAAYLPKEVINKTQKLVLMKIADSADDQTRLARPGLDRMTAWAGVGANQVITVVTELVGLGLVERTEIGRAGRRAEYRVFPYGVPPIPSTEELMERRSASQRAPRNPRLARQPSPRGKPSMAARTRDDVSARETARAAPAARHEPGFPQGNPGDGQKRVPPGEPSGFPHGDPVGSPRGTPSLPPSSYSLPNPPTPAAGTGGEGEEDEQTGQQPASGCPAHPQPVDGCRGCGTNARARREQAQREAAERERMAQRAWLREFFAEQERRVADSDPVALEMARQRTRELARLGRARRPNSLDT
ncbi:helix-turn-helix domain-containing protein [Streptomyces sp. NPDC001351]|uniref:helix-turn-helix domain-containing protein n=1 Tax=Streptomyces sp. NPDC001351 TaxID=3364564 RepID=UPI0036AA5375